MAASPQGVFAGSLPELYERFLVVPLFRPFAEQLLTRAGTAPGDRVLDVACGTGILARLAHERSGGRARVVGIDLSPAMMAMARSIAPAIDWREGHAAQLPVGDDETFDVVACHQGLQFFQEKPPAVREMRRVLAPHGRVALATWCPVAEIPLMRAMQAIAERHLGPVTDQRHSFGEREAIRGLLAEAGFRSIHSDTFTAPVRMSDGVAVFSRLNTMAIVGMSAAAKAMTDDQRSRVVAEIANDSVEALRPYAEGTDLVFDLSSTMTTAEA